MFCMNLHKSSSDFLTNHIFIICSENNANWKIEVMTQRPPDISALNTAAESLKY